MPEDPDQALPRLQFLLAQRPAHVRQHHELMRKPTLAESCTVETPASGDRVLTGKAALQSPHRLAFEAIPECKSFSALAENPLRRLGEQALAGAIHQLQPLPAVKSKHRDVDLLHHLAQQGG